MARQGLKLCRGLPGASLFWGSGSAAQNLQEGIFFPHERVPLGMLAGPKVFGSQLDVDVSEVHETR